LVQLGQLAEAQGFDAVLVNEGRGDALACAEAIALATTRVTVGTNIAKMYLRHPCLTAMTAQTITELSDGRLILGLGISHRPLIESLGIAMDNPRDALRSYVHLVQQALRGESIGPFFHLRPTTHPVPIYLAALTVETAAVGGEIAAGIMPFLPTRTYLSRLLAAAREAARNAGKDPHTVDCIVSIPTFISDDLQQARSAARYNLAYFSRLPYYRRQWRRCGFVDEMNALQACWQQQDRRAAAALIPDRMVDEICVFGPPDQCREQLAAFREAGAAMPMLAVSPVNEERHTATEKALRLLAP
jgi:alkanesulfonate monooxygenase SsuD/methylene tetrahydromethanopterin reductase-like flavin-dependent oxidoreductase (luciferase family)